MRNIRFSDGDNALAEILPRKDSDPSSRNQATAGSCKALSDSGKQNMPASGGPLATRPL